MSTTKHEVVIPVGNLHLKGVLVVPAQPKAVVIFSHGSGSSRFSPRNTFVASELNKRGMATLLVDLLTPQEDSIYENRFDIDLLTSRLIAVTAFVHVQPELHHLPLGYFGASTGAASALNAAERLGKQIKAVVSRGGRPDLADADLPLVKAPTLLIVGGLDTPVIEMNNVAYKDLHCQKKMVIVDGATHLFEEPGKLEEVARFASDWFENFLIKTDSPKLNYTGHGG